MKSELDLCVVSPYSRYLIKILNLFIWCVHFSVYYNAFYSAIVPPHNSTCHLVITSSKLKLYSYSTTQTEIYYFHGLLLKLAEIRFRIINFP